MNDIEDIENTSIEELFIEYKKLIYKNDKTKQKKLILIEEYLMSKAYDVDQIKMMEKIENPELKSYENYDLCELATYIQYYVNMKYFEPPKLKLTNLLDLYKKKGGDIEYFIYGAGAHGNCIIL